MVWRLAWVAFVLLVLASCASCSGAEDVEAGLVNAAAYCGLTALLLAFVRGATRGCWDQETRW